MQKGPNAAILPQLTQLLVEKTEPFQLDPGFGGLKSPGRRTRGIINN